MKRKWMVCLGSLLVVAAVVASTRGKAIAQTYPSKYIKVFVPAPAGGGTDILARIIGDKFTKS